MNYTKKSKPLIVLVFSLLSLFVMTLSSFWAFHTVEGKYDGLVIGFALLLVAVIPHVCAGKKHFLYIVSWAINTIGTGCAVSCYYLHNEIQLDLFKVFISTVPAYLILVACGLLLWKYPDKKRKIIIVSFLFAVLLIVISVVLWNIIDALLYSFAFFALVEALIYLSVNSITVGVYKRTVFRDISFGGFGLAIVIILLVVSLVTEDGSPLEAVSEAFSGTTDAKKKGKR